jgi:adenylosuccinate synthase
MDLPLLRYSVMVNGISWLVITKLDVLDELRQIPVCTGYSVKGKKTSDVPAQALGYDQLKPVYKDLPGWRTSTAGITSFAKLPAKAQQYLRFLEAESGAKIGMVSTGPDREQTMFMDDFRAAMGIAAGKAHTGTGKARARRRSK